MDPLLNKRGMGRVMQVVSDKFKQEAGVKNNEYLKLKML